MFAANLNRKPLIFLLLLTVAIPVTVSAQKKKLPEERGVPVLWRDPGNISTRDLRYGPGSAELAPVAPFTFVEEDKDGESPKFVVTDARDVKWSVKLGVEAQAETVATRIVWAAGYFAEEAYYLDRAEIQNLPRLSRGTKYIENGTTAVGARFEPRRENIKRGPTWTWLKNPFVGTREFNALKVLMVLLANYDTSTANNRILTEKNSANGRSQDRYVVTDIGATLGHVGGLGGKRSKNNLPDFRSQQLVKRVDNRMVEFNYRTRPSGLGYLTFVFSPGYWKSQSNKEKAMGRVPVAHARWMGTMLSRLRDDQLRDAFQAAGYDTGTMEGFVKALRTRINEIIRPVPGRFLPSQRRVSTKRRN